MEIILPSRSSSSTQPVSMLNLQALSSYFMFVSFLPYSTFTVVTFVIRFFDADRTQNEVLGAYRIESRYRLSTAKSSSAKRMAIRFWTHSRRERAFILLSEENKKSEPFSYREKVRIFIVWCTKKNQYTLCAGFSFLFARWKGLEQGGGA